jgi:Bacterial SH3 domain
MRGRELTTFEKLVLAGVGYRAYQKGKNPFFAMILFPFKMMGVVIVLYLIIGIIASIVNPDFDKPDPVTTGSSPVSSGGGSVAPSYGGPPIPVSATSSSTAPAPVAPAISGLAPVDDLGKTLSDTEVIDTSGTVIGTVHAGRPVHIIGATPTWLRIRKHDGREGFIPVNAANDVGAWVGSAPEMAGSP